MPPEDLLWTLRLREIFMPRMTVCKRLFATIRLQLNTLRNIAKMSLDQISLERRAYMTQNSFARQLRDGRQLEYIASIGETHQLRRD